MHYAMLIFENDPELRRPDYHGAWLAYHKAMISAGVWVSGHALEPVSIAGSAPAPTPQGRVQDGPFAETREQLGGYIILDVPSLQGALEWAARCPAVAYGAIEVRRVSLASSSWRPAA